MTALDWIFKFDSMFDVTKLEDYRTYFTVMPDHKIVTLEARDWVKQAGSGFDEDFYSMLSVCLGMADEKLDEYFCGIKNKYRFIPYENFAFLQGITVEGDITKFMYPSQRKQLVCVRGTCDHRCPECVPEYSGYSLYDLPCCDRQLVGTSVWTGKWSTSLNILEDIFFWMQYCKGLDVLVVNFDFTPNKDFPDLPYHCVCFAAHIQGNHIRLITNFKECRKLFDEYSIKYACMDYQIEKSISDRREGWQFSFLKPDGL